MNEMDEYMDNMDDLDGPGPQRWEGRCHVERICGQCMPGIQGAVVSEQHTRLEECKRSGSLALVEKTSQRGIADDRDLEFSTWVAGISSNCEIETRETRETETERIHTERERERN
jgi:hypothetical protein